MPRTCSWRAHLKVREEIIPFHLFTSSSLNNILLVNAQLESDACLDAMLILFNYQFTAFAKICTAVVFLHLCI
jgi:hypothetical protein